MARRIEVELTSSREDGIWTWRAAGARQPKGELNGSLLYDSAAIGDVVKVEADFHVDGIEITEVFPPKQKKARTDLLEMVSRPVRDDELVTEVKASRGGRGGGRGGRDRGDRGDRGGDRGQRRERGDRRPRRSEADERPKPKRLRPRRVHRDAVLAGVPEEHRPIAEQVLQGGMPAVRAALEKQRAEAKAAGAPEVNEGPILAIAEPLVPTLRVAEWRDRAENALELLTELDLRDLRSVVVAGDEAAKDEESRAIVEQLKSGLAERIEADHAQWLKDVQSAVNDGRTVRALRLSSRPVKAGAPLPTELANRLAASASAALAADVMPDRWATVLDAVAFTPIRSAVVPAGYPTDPSEEFLEEVRRVADRVPTIAAHYGIDPAEAEKAKKRRPRRNNRKGGPNKSQSSGDKSQSSGDKSQSSGNKSQSSGDKSQSSGNKSQSSGNKSQSSGTKSQSSGDKSSGTDAAVDQTSNAAAPAEPPPVTPAGNEAETAEAQTPDAVAPETATPETVAPDAVAPDAVEADAATSTAAATDGSSTAESA